MSARDRVLALWTERGWAMGVSADAGGWRAWAKPSLREIHEGAGPTEEAACEALLARLEPALPVGHPADLVFDLLVLLAECRPKGQMRPDLRALLDSPEVRVREWLAATFPGPAPSGWVGVGDRLPPPGRWVPVASEMGGVFGAFRSHDASAVRWILPSGDAVLPSVVAWFDLPPLPEAKP